MKQILQNLKTGETELADIPCPRLKPGHLLIRSRRSVVSAGTERMLIEFGKAGLLEKAWQQPDRVRQVWDKVKTDGLLPTLESVQARLDQPLSLGYSNAGVVLEVGDGVEGFAVGDRVVSNGPHAEIVQVPCNLCAKIPGHVSDEAAAFTVLGSISLQAVRLAQPTLGECFVVTGLGLIGLMAVQLLRAHGCRVLGIDLDSTRLALARQCGAETVDLSMGQDPLRAAHALSLGRGVDGVIIAASTAGSEPVRQAAQMCRQRGRIVLVGVVGLELSRDDFYKKELTFQVSCSYGPGRYDPSYEERSQDYPLGFVRWTAQRNFEAVLGQLREGRLVVEPLISHRIPLDRVTDAYEAIQRGSGLGVLIEYPPETHKSNETLRIRTLDRAPRPKEEFRSVAPAVAFIGAGNFATRVLIPAFRDSGARLKTVATNGGVSGTHAARRFGFEQDTTDVESLFGDPEISAVVIASRHDSHARLACQGLQAGKHVFVEKPLALNRDQLAEIVSVYASAGARCPAPLLMVGFNRRFAPHVKKMKALLDGVRGPKCFIITVNAGSVPAGHWTQDPAVGGGRLIGEGCHFIDLLRFLAGHAVTGVQSARPGRRSGGEDQISVTLCFADGSVGTVHYLANGHRSFPKERLEVFCGGRVLQLDNFKRLTGYGWPGFRTMRLWRQDKGYRGEVEAFLERVQHGGPSPIPFEELVEVAKVSFSMEGAGGQSTLDV
jgi:predicted dehydrogenase/threonine dehydrogenase-like Zn-dependent dehydrogenase